MPDFLSRQTILPWSKAWREPEPALAMRGQGCALAPTSVLTSWVALQKPQASAPNSVKTGEVRMWLGGMEGIPITPVSQALF